MSSSAQAATANNGFGVGAYWNQPTQGRQRQGKLTSKYLSLKPKTQKTNVKTQPRSPSPTLPHNSTRTVITP